jgi:hypothetical protein
VNDWTRIAERLVVAEISRVLDRRHLGGEDRRVSGLLRTAAAAVAGSLLLGGCAGGSEAPEAGPSSVQAVPDVPHFTGRLAVVLQPGLKVLADAPCQATPEEGRVCSADGTATYRVLGDGRPATVVEARTDPTPDHTAWDATVRFARTDATAVSASREDAAAVGGLVLVTAGSRVLQAVAPRDLRAREVTLFGLEKPEAWAITAVYADL